MEPRLPAHLEVAGLIRRTQAEGGFAAILAKGEREAGTILVVITERGRNSRLYERMPQLDGDRSWRLSREQKPDEKGVFQEYLDRRKAQDADLWILELDIANGERLIGLQCPET